MIEIYNSLGQIHKTHMTINSNTSEIQTKGLTFGLYDIKISSDNKTELKRALIK